MNRWSLFCRHGITKAFFLFSLPFLFLSACSRPTPSAPTAEAPPSTPPPAAPASTTTALPKPAPEKVYYVIKYFSVSTDTGVHGFTPGMPVKFVRQDGKMLVVSDGRLRVRASAANFTSDPAVRDKVLAHGPEAIQPQKPVAFASSAPLPLTPEASPFVSSPKTSATPNFQALRERKAARDAAVAAAGKSKRIKQLQEQIADLDQRIKAAEAEISARGSKQAANPRHYTYDAWGNATLYQGTYVVTYSADATGIEQLRIDREKHKQRLAQLTAD